jgi:hypothetical protein
MRGEDEDELQAASARKTRAGQRRRRLTDSNSICAEWPKMKEKPSTIDASGTSDVTVSVGLKMRRQMKMSSRSQTPRSVASSLATADETSCAYGRLVSAASV